MAQFVKAVVIVMNEGKANIYLISSDEPLLKKDRSDELCATARKLLPDAQYLIFASEDFKSAGPQANLSRIENELRDPGLFSGDRIIKLYFKDYDSTAAQVLDCIARYFRPGVFVIVDLPRLNSSFAKLAPRPILDKPTKRNELKNAAISYIKGLGGSLEIIYPPSPAQLPRFIGERCLKHGFSIEPQALQMLCALNEGNLTAIDQALQIMDLNTKKGIITQADLSVYFVEDSRFSAFEFAEALLSGQGTRALNILHSVMSSQAGGANAHLPLILSRLDSCLNLICKIKQQQLPDPRANSMLQAAGIVTPALKRACLQAARNMPENLLSFLIKSLKDCALLHSHFKGDEAVALLQTMSAAVCNFGAMAYGARS